MSFEKTFMSLLTEDLKPYQKNGFRRQDRLRQQWVPDSHKTDLTKKSKIEILRGKEHGMEVCDINDLIYILNNYIFQGNEQPSNKENAFNLAKKHLAGRQGKHLGTTGIVVFLDPTTQSYRLKK